MMASAKRGRNKLHITLHTLLARECCCQRSANPLTSTYLKGKPDVGLCRRQTVGLGAFCGIYRNTGFHGCPTSQMQWKIPLKHLTV